MKSRILTLIIFICSLTALCISLKLFWNMGVHVDEYGISPDVVYGGKFWLYMAWLRLVLLTAATVVSGIKLFSSE